MAEPVYKQIIEHIRQQILTGQIKPGDRLPTVREFTKQWKCTTGTIQRAYRELANQGLVVSRIGSGTQVAGEAVTEDNIILRRATLIHRAEAFLLEVITSGYGLPEIQQAVEMAMERWRVVEQLPDTSNEQIVRFSGSHDLGIAWITNHFGQIAPGYKFDMRVNGSLAGLMKLAEGECDIAGSHLWDPNQDAYNVPFAQHLFPNQKIALVTVAYRIIGLILPRSNPLNIQSLQDLTQPGVRFVNRQPGSGTRVWLDAALHKQGIDAHQITDYDNEKSTHSEVARAIAEGQANAGIGLQASALDHALHFIPLTRERYDLIIPQNNLEKKPIQSLVNWLGSPSAREALSKIEGYDVSSTGEITWLN